MGIALQWPAWTGYKYVIEPSFIVKMFFYEYVPSRASSIAFCVLHFVCALAHTFVNPQVELSGVDHVYAIANAFSDVLTLDEMEVARSYIKDDVAIISYAHSFFLSSCVFEGIGYALRAWYAGHSAEAELTKSGQNKFRVQLIFLLIGSISTLHGVLIIVVQVFRLFQISVTREIIATVIYWFIPLIDVAVFFMAIVGGAKLPVQGDDPTYRTVLVAATGLQVALAGLLTLLLLWVICVDFFKSSKLLGPGWKASVVFLLLVVSLLLVRSAVRMDEFLKGPPSKSGWWFDVFESAFLFIVNLVFLFPFSFNILMPLSVAAVLFKYGRLDEKGEMFSRPQGAGSSPQETGEPEQLQEKMLFPKVAGEQSQLDVSNHV